MILKHVKCPVTLWDDVRRHLQESRRRHFQDLIHRIHGIHGIQAQCPQQSGFGSWVTMGHLAELVESPVSRSRSAACQWSLLGALSALNSRPSRGLLVRQGTPWNFHRNKKPLWSKEKWATKQAIHLIISRVPSKISTWHDRSPLLRCPHRSDTLGLRDQTWWVPKKSCQSCKCSPFFERQPPSVF